MLKNTSVEENFVEFKKKCEIDARKVMDKDRT